MGAKAPDRIRIGSRRKTENCMAWVCVRARAEIKRPRLNENRMKRQAFRNNHSQRW